MTADGSDLAVVRRAGRIAAVQASLALAAVLLVVGAVVFLVDVRVQNKQIAEQLTSVASTADDATDPPPGMQLVLRDLTGKVQASATDLPSADLLGASGGVLRRAYRRQAEPGPGRRQASGQGGGTAGAGPLRGGPEPAVARRWVRPSWPAFWRRSRWSSCSPDAPSVRSPKHWPCSGVSSPMPPTSSARR